MDLNGPIIELDRPRMDLDLGLIMDRPEITSRVLQCMTLKDLWELAKLLLYLAGQVILFSLLGTL